MAYPYDERLGRTRLIHAVDANLSSTLINEFTCRPHWTKNTRDILTQALKNLDQDVSGIICGAETRYPLTKPSTSLARLKTVREDFDPNGVFKSVVGEIIGVY